MRLIENIVDKILDNDFYTLGLTLFVFLTIFLFCGLGANAYREKLETEVKLAKIAAGQVVECDCGFKSKCK